MDTLFPLEPLTPRGFFYLDHFITPDQEQLLLEEIRKQELHPLIFQGFEAKRKVQSFGYDYHFDKRRITPGKAIPAAFSFLAELVGKELSLPAERFEEVLVSEYPPGAVINWHRDAPPFDIIVGISLLADCDFRFRPYDKSLRGRGMVRSVPVKRRSLYVMQGEARTEWEHSIQPVKETRFSITLRTLRR